MSFSFGTPKTATGFSLAGNTNTTTAPTTTGGMGDVSNVQNKPSLLFGTLPQSTSFPGLGTAFTTTTTTTAPTFGFTPTTVSSNAATTGFRLSAPPVTSSTAGFNLGATTTPTTLGFGTSAPAAKTTIGASAAPQFSLGASTISTTTTATAAAATTSASFTPILGIATTNAASTTSSAIPLKIGSSSTTTATSTPSITTGLSLGTTSTTTSAIATTTAITTTTTTIPQTGTLTYAQLEDSINKWTIDLEEQGKLFINQAKELNAWDNLLISNGEKMVQLNETIERVKQQQKQLDQELDFVLAQQNELDELSLPLEKQLADIPITDQNRFQMYQLSEIIDSQLKQMSEDLKEIVEHLNESNKNEDTSDPVIQISRILNAHMNSLQWIDRNTTQITAHLEQISKLQDFHKKNQLNYQ